MANDPFTINSVPTTQYHNMTPLKSLKLGYPHEVINATHRDVVEQPEGGGAAAGGGGDVV